MKVAVIGLGFMGATHVKAIHDSPEVELRGVVSSDAVKLSGDLSGIHGNLGGPAGQMDFTGVNKYGIYQDALNDPDIEAVDICLPTYLHAPVAIAALEAGKHVLVEKPMALDGDSAEQMIDAARQNQRVLMVAQVLRFFPAYLALERALASGSLGKLHSATFRRRCAAPGWNVWLAESAMSGGGVFDLLIHDVDMCLHLFGLPSELAATGYEDLGCGIDVVSAQFYYEDIPSVSVCGGWHRGGAYPFSMEYTVVTDGGTLEYNSAEHPPTLYSVNGHADLLPCEDVNGYQAEIEYFVRCCRDRVAPDRCKPEDSARTVRLTRAMADARHLRGEKVPCPI
jgi:predicted dehydrogenase